MPTATSESLENLRTALISLKPTGADGFEGLLAVILSKITGQDFRLAKSGLQNGKDGETLASDNHISFEAKRYDSKLNDNEVLTKITRLIGSSSPPDVWVLGATIEVSTQLLEPMQKAAAKNGIGTIVLDWPSASAVPPLAAACALAHEETIAFLDSHVANAKLVEKAKSALVAIFAAETFTTSSDTILRALHEPSLAVLNARAANAEWLETAFSDRSRARAVFGQLLSPNASGPLPLRPRANLTQQVRQHLTSSPSQKIVALVGGEGCGKSWLFVQSWLGLSERPLMVIIPATDLKPVAAYGNFAPLLISKLIQQTGDSGEDVARKRWERRLKYWQEQPHGVSPRFIVCVDGLNQQPNFDWPRWLDDAASMIDEYGGVLCVSARESYFNERIRKSTHTKIDAVRVPEWTSSELNEILSAKDIDATKVKPTVLARLKNPRILSIAAELLDSVAIQNFTELSVDRLLFEHIRIGARDGNTPESPDQFVKRLAQHAQAILDRVKLQQNTDCLIFDRADNASVPHELNADLLAVTAEHFFRPLPEDPTLYKLADEGLSLALGLSIIKALQKAERNGRSVPDVLDELVEPIAALDKTAEAVFSSLMVASIDDRCSLEIKRALICGFLRLQNIDAHDYPAFVAVARNSTDAAMWSLLDLFTAKARYTANSEWLSFALREARQTTECWNIIKEHISNWLRSYSLDPKIGVMSLLSGEGPDKVVVETNEKKIALEAKCAELSAKERRFLEEKMSPRKDFDPSIMNGVAFELLAGMPLASFAEPLVACSFSRALNSNFSAPYDEYLALIRFNRRDWKETRDGLLAACSFLIEGEASRTGKWALVAILRGLSTAEDANEEIQIIEELMRDREQYSGFRLVEKYCATDPCDPLSERPNNIEETAQRYSEIKINEVAKNRDMGSEDHFIRDARPGLARFSPETAIAVQREFAASVVTRKASELMRGVTSLEPHSAALEGETVNRLLEIAKSLSSPRDPSSRDSRDEWITSQYAIQIAFPHLDGDSQLALLSALPPHGPPLLKLAEVLKPATPSQLELILEEAFQAGDHNRELVALIFARYSGSEMTARSRTLISQFTKSRRSSVRAEAMNIIAHLKDPDIIESIVSSGWSAAGLNPKDDHFEIWYGSLIIIYAAELKVLSIKEVLERITPRLYSTAAEILGSDIHPFIAAYLASAVEKALDIVLPFTPPQVEQTIELTSQSVPPLLSLAEPAEALGPQAFFRRMMETPENFEARQRQGWEAFNDFEVVLTTEQARLIVEYIGFEAVEAFVTVLPGDCVDLAERFLNLNDSKLMHVHNFGLILAKCISGHNPLLARKLFDRLSGKRAFVNLGFGPSAVSLEAICIWESAQNEELDMLRSKRLDFATTDYHLAQEVMAALMVGKLDFLQRYALENLESSEPVANARALMVIGFGEESATSDELLARYGNANGLIGKAAKTARFAYDRNSWAKHWFEKMSRTESPDEFWSLSTLFLKIVDARFGLWGQGVPPKGSAIRKFEPGIRNKMENRVKAWKTHREKTLCGDKTPKDVYVVTD